MRTSWDEVGNNLFVSRSGDILAIRITEDKIYRVGFEAESYPSFVSVEEDYSPEAVSRLLVRLQTHHIGWYVRKNNNFLELSVDADGEICEAW